MSMYVHVKKLNNEKKNNSGAPASNLPLQNDEEEKKEERKEERKEESKIARSIESNRAINLLLQQ